MSSWEESLPAVLRGEVCVVGVGNRQKGDDGAGPALVDLIRGGVRARCLDAGVAPENFLEKIAAGRPDTVLVVDAADFGGKPGDVGVLEWAELSAGGLDTHAPSLRLVCEYLRQRGIQNIVVVGIQPQSCGLGNGISRPVSEALDKLSAVFENLLAKGEGRSAKDARKGGEEKMRMKEKTAADIMTSPVVTAKPDMKLTEVIQTLLRWHISGMPVVDDSGNLVGIISEHDIMNFALSGDAPNTTAGEVMTREVISFKPDADVATLINCYATKRFRRVPIVKDGKVVGIVSRREILREMNRLYNG